jgi:hypothetical protein
MAPSIPPFRLVREPVSPEAEALPGFEWASEEVGQRHQLGGEPQWLQGDATPVCRECGEPMTFYGQLDSVNDDIVLADVGLVYVFVCFNDFQAQAIVQSG